MTVFSALKTMGDDYVLARRVVIRNRWSLPEVIRVTGCEEVIGDDLLFERDSFVSVRDQRVVVHFVQINGASGTGFKLEASNEGLIHLERRLGEIGFRTAGFREQASVNIACKKNFSESNPNIAIWRTHLGEIVCSTFEWKGRGHLRISSKLPTSDISNWWIACLPK
jgi:hypothetical protein